MFRVGLAEILLYVLPVTIGVIAGRYLRPVPNFLLMFLVFYIDVAGLMLWSRGIFRPFALLAGIIFSPGGGLIPLLLMVLVALKFSRGITRLWGGDFLHRR
jgi:hypothetical protein